MGIKKTETTHITDDTNFPLVSIIVITYNSSKFVLETLESAKAQTYQNIELIISDDCSKDDTVAICSKWLDENKARFVRTELITVPENTGIPANCNRGVRASKGEWVKLIAGDDALVEECISSFIKFTSSNRQVSFIHSNINLYYNTFDDENLVEEFYDKNVSIRNNNLTSCEQFQILLRKNQIYAPTSFIKLKLLTDNGLFEEKYKLWEDRPMWLKLTLNGVKLYYLDFKSVNYRYSATSISLSKSKNVFYSKFDISRMSYMQDFNKYLKPYERFIKTTNFKRIATLKKIGLNKKNRISGFAHRLTGFLLENEINRINSKY